MNYPQSVLFSKNNISNPQDDEIGEVCIANISPKERLIRKKFGVRVFIITLVILVILIALRVDPVWRLPLFLLFSTATTSYIQALDKT